MSEHKRCSLRYVDIRCGDTSEQVSLDLARHLPRRLTAGAAVILTDYPRRFLPALRKRWMRVTREVERQRASTLDRDKRQALEYELARMKAFRFGAAPCRRPVDVLLVSGADSVPAAYPCLTLYATCGTNRDCLRELLRILPGLELLVVYRRSDGLPQHNPDGVQSYPGVEALIDLV